MSRVDAIARTVLYEGYSLYPYRESSLKNRRRVLFGTLFPRAWAEGSGTGDAFEASTECLLESSSSSSLLGIRLTISVRFLRLVAGGAEAKEESITIDDVSIADLALDAATTPMANEASGCITASAVVVKPNLARVRVNVANLTPIAKSLERADAELHGFGAAHIVIRITDRAARSAAGTDARWISLTDPPNEHVEHVTACVQSSLWPVLVGTDAILASPIILYDQPEIAPESAAGDLFDATEIEEILALRVQTLTDDEKAELRRTATTRALLERVDGLSADELHRLHGTLRHDSKARTRVLVGDSVIVRPKARADALDTILAGMTATVVSIEETLEGEELVCVTIDDDPGRDLGVRGFPGHRFFFRPDEIEKAKVDAR